VDIWYDGVFVSVVSVCGECFLGASDGSWDVGVEDGDGGEVVGDWRGDGACCDLHVSARGKCRVD